MSQGRSARVNRDSDGESLGANIFLSGSDLADLGIDPNTRTVAYRVRDGQIVVEEGDA